MLWAYDTLSNVLNGYTEDTLLDVEDERITNYQNKVREI